VLPGLSAYPSAIRGLRAQAAGQVETCFKCRKAPTRVAYLGVDGRRWPTCLDCARAAVREPCPVCRYVGPTMRSWAPLPEGGGRLTYEHDDGRVCHPLNARERYTVTCSSCSSPLRFIVNATPAHVDGAHPDLRCACGVAWRLEGVAVGIRVYVTAA